MSFFFEFVLFFCAHKSNGNRRPALGDRVPYRNMALKLVVN